MANSGHARLIPLLYLNYHECLAALFQNVDVNIRLHAVTDSQARNNAIQEHFEARVATRIAVQEVALIGPTRMSDLAHEAESLGDISDDASREGFSLTFARLITAMRVDLGEPLE